RLQAQCRLDSRNNGTRRCLMTRTASPNLPGLMLSPRRVAGLDAILANRGLRVEVPVSGEDMRAVANAPRIARMAVEDQESYFVAARRLAAKMGARTDRRRLGSCFSASLSFGYHALAAEFRRSAASRVAG